MVDTQTIGSTGPININSSSYKPTERERRETEAWAKVQAKGVELEAKRVKVYRLTAEDKAKLDAAIESQQEAKTVQAKLDKAYREGRTLSQAELDLINKRFGTNLKAQEAQQAQNQPQPVRSVKPVSSSPILGPQAFDTTPKSTVKPLASNPIIGREKPVTISEEYRMQPIEYYVNPRIISKTSQVPSDITQKQQEDLGKAFNKKEERYGGIIGVASNEEYKTEYKPTASFIGPFGETIRYGAKKVGTSIIDYSKFTTGISDPTKSTNIYVAELGGAAFYGGIGFVRGIGDVFGSAYDVVRLKEPRLVRSGGEFVKGVFTGEAAGAVASRVEEIGFIPTAAEFFGYGEGVNIGIKVPYSVGRKGYINYAYGSEEFYRIYNKLPNKYKDMFLKQVEALKQATKVKPVFIAEFDARNLEGIRPSEANIINKWVKEYNLEVYGSTAARTQVKLSGKSGDVDTAMEDASVRSRSINDLYKQLKKANPDIVYKKTITGVQKPSSSGEYEHLVEVKPVERLTVFSKYRPPLETPNGIIVMDIREQAYRSLTGTYERGIKLQKKGEISNFLDPEQNKDLRRFQEITPQLFDYRKGQIQNSLFFKGWKERGRLSGLKAFEEASYGKSKVKVPGYGEALLGKKVISDVRLFLESEEGAVPRRDYIKKMNGIEFDIRTGKAINHIYEKSNVNKIPRTLYHFTTKESARDILKEGLLINKGARDTGWLSKGIFLTDTSREVPLGAHGNVILKVNILNKDLKYIDYSPSRGDIFGEAIVSKNIPKSQISLLKLPKTKSEYGGVPRRDILIKNKEVLPERTYPLGKSNIPRSVSSFYPSVPQKASSRYGPSFNLKKPSLPYPKSQNKQSNNYGASNYPKGKRVVLPNIIIPPSVPYPKIPRQKTPNFSYPELPRPKKHFYPVTPKQKTPDTFYPKSPKPFIPRTPSFPVRTYFIPSSERKDSLYDVFVKLKGKWVRVNVDPLPRAAALALGKRVVENTAARSFKIVRVGAVRPESLFVLESEAGYKYRPSKKYEGVAIQKSKYSISSFGELKEITYKGIRAIRNKARKFNLLGNFKY